MLDQIRILMGDEVTKRTHRALAEGLARVGQLLNDSIEREKPKNAFLTGVDDFVQAIASGKIQCRVYVKKKFLAKAYITHGKLAVVGFFALVGSKQFHLSRPHRQCRTQRTTSPRSGRSSAMV